MLYYWHGPEEALARMPITATRMSIGSVKDLPDGRKYAEGTFDFADHIEGSHGHDPWEAFGVVAADGKVSWTVTRKDDGRFCFQNKAGEFLFTLIEAVNADIKKFVVSKLEEVTDQRTKATTGPHQRVEVLGTHDCNGLTMVTCRDCKTTAHAIDELHAKANLAKVACSPDCANCKALRDSYQEQPALPAGAEDYDGLLHVCPHDGNRWWQSNRHFHLWQQVTDDGEWETVQGWLRSGNY